MTDLFSRDSYFIANEEKISSEKSSYISNYEKRLLKEEEYLSSLLSQKKEAQNHCKEMKNKIEQMKMNTKNKAISNSDLEKEIQQLEAQLNKIEVAIQEKWGDDRELNSSGTAQNENNLKATYATIKRKLQLYKDCLGCSVRFEEPDIYVFSCQLDDEINGFIKFQFNDFEWKVLDYEPKELFSDEILQEFEDIQDTHRLIDRSLGRRIRF